MSPITAGVIDQFFVPPPDQLVKSLTSPVALSNPYSGSGNLLTASGGMVAASSISIPEYLTLQLGAGATGGIQEVGNVFQIIVKDNIFDSQRRRK